MASLVFRSAVISLLVALFVSFAWDRWHVLRLFYSNAPERIPRINTFKSHEIKFADTIRSCEDALLIQPAGVAILPCDPGRERWNSVLGYFIPGPVSSGKLYLYDYQNPAATDGEALKRFQFVDFEAEEDFHSLGMAFDEASSTLFVTNHRHDGPSVEMFHMDFAAVTARHIRSIRHPLIRGPNSITLLSDKEFFVTNDHHFLMKENPVLSQIETYLALPFGTVVHVSIADPTSVEASVVARLPYVNGIELINKTTVAIASTSTASVRFYAVSTTNGTKAAPELTYSSKIRVPFNVDNLSLSSDGRLLMAGHPHVPTLTKFSKTRYVCNDPAELENAGPEMQEYCKNAVTASWVSEWTEEGGLKHLYADTEYPTSATAAWDAERKVGIVAGLYARGVLVWRD